MSYPLTKGRLFEAGPWLPALRASTSVGGWNRARRSSDAKATESTCRFKFDAAHGHPENIANASHSHMKEYTEVEDATLRNSANLWLEPANASRSSDHSRLFGSWMTRWWDRTKIEIAARMTAAPAHVTRMMFDPAVRVGAPLARSRHQLGGRSTPLERSAK